MKILKCEDYEDQIEGLINNKKQFHGRTLFLTVNKIYRLTGEGRVDFGGWIRGGDKEWAGNKPAGLLQNGYIFVSTNFRQIPDGIFPNHCQDIASAVSWVYENISDYGGNPDKIFLMGHSSGAHLVPLVSNDERYLKENGLTLNVIKGVIPNDQTLYDVTLLGAIWGGFLNGQVVDAFSQDAKYWKFASPINYVKLGNDIPPHIVPFSNMNGPVFAENYIDILNYNGFNSILLPATDKSHGSIDGDIGLPDDHVTQKIIKFMKNISPYERLIYSKDYYPGTLDDSNKFIGGTETTHLVTHNRKLFAAIGYKNDATYNDPIPGPQILLKEDANSAWKEDKSFKSGSRGFIGSLKSITFKTDKDGNTLVPPQTILLASPNMLDKNISIFSRNDDSDSWTEMIVKNNVKNAYINILTDHFDKTNGIHYIFAGTTESALYRGAYDPDTPGNIFWNSEPELTSSNKIDSTAIANGDLYIAMSSNGNPSDHDGGLFKRLDGKNPSWKFIYEWRIPSEEFSGMRGLTAVPDPEGGLHEVLIGARESTGFIDRINPLNNYQITSEYNIRNYFSSIWDDFNNEESITTANDMLPVADPDAGEKYHLIGLNINHPENSNPLFNGSYFLIRHIDGSYTWENIYDKNNNTKPLDACRTIANSPFPEDNGKALYLGGFDANYGSHHNSACVYRAQFPENECEPASFARVDIRSKGKWLKIDDQIKISLTVDNYSLNNIDIYPAIELKGSYYFYPEWNNKPSPITLENSSSLKDVILETKITSEIKNLSPGYTFHAFATEHNSSNIIGSDLVKIQIE